MPAYDLHTHSHFSVDGHDTVQQLAAAAVGRGLAGIAVTDHLDWHPLDAGYGIYDPARRDAEITAARQQYAGKLKILKGIEIAEANLYRHAYQQVLAGDYDIIIGSMHWVGGAPSGSPAAADETGFKSFIHAYFCQLLDMLQLGGFSVLAHLDFPLRYFGRRELPQALVDQVLAEAARQGIALELNTSGLRKPYGATLPGRQILLRFAELGGRYVTVGSDAHRSADIAAGFDTAAALLQGTGLQLVTFVNRRPVPQYPD